MQKGVNTVGVYKSQNRLYFQRKRLARYNLPYEPLLCLKSAKNAVYGQISFGCYNVPLVILAHFPEFVVFVHSASQTFVVLGEFSGLFK